MMREGIEKPVLPPINKQSLISIKRNEIYNRINKKYSACHSPINYITRRIMHLHTSLLMPRRKAESQPRSKKLTLQGLSPQWKRDSQVAFKDNKFSRENLFNIAGYEVKSSVAIRRVYHKAIAQRNTSNLLNRNSKLNIDLINPKTGIQHYPNTFKRERQIKDKCTLKEDIQEDTDQLKRFVINVELTPKHLIVKN
uniref:Uncharacterized protein n=1 Tax=Nyctotherus ovalis TaxID=70075 RepID=A6MI43_NYCOV|nr:hypothetical protein [Nyctotherus ovalis]